MENNTKETISSIVTEIMSLSVPELLELNEELAAKFGISLSDLNSGPANNKTAAIVEDDTPKTFKVVLTAVDSSKIVPVMKVVKEKSNKTPPLSIGEAKAIVDQVIQGNQKDILGGLDKAKAEELIKLFSDNGGTATLVAE